MKNLFKYAGMYWKAMIAIVAVLILQAYCDLSLPAYTSDIVNVGIQQGGIEDKVPKQLSAADMEKLLLFVSDEDQETVKAAYQSNSADYDTEAYILKESAEQDEEKVEELSDILSVPMMLVTGFESGSDMTKEIEGQLFQALPQGALPQDATIFDVLKALPQEEREAFVNQAEEKMKEMPETILEQAAIGFSKMAYEDLGIDMDQLQIRYLIVTGGKMVGLAFLGMAASVLVGFLASRVGALLRLDSDTFYIYHVAAVMVDNLRRLLLGINLSDKAVMDFDFPGVGFPV